MQGKKTGGRVKGTPNKVTPEIRELAQGLFDKDYWQRTKAKLLDNTLPPQLEAKMLAYAYGEPKQEKTTPNQVLVVGFLGTSPHTAQIIDVTPQPVPSSKTCHPALGSGFSSPGPSDAG